MQQDTPVTITASYKGVTPQRSMTLVAGVPPTSLTLDPTTTTGTQGTSGRVAIAEPATRDVQINLTSSNPAVAHVPSSVTIPMFSPHAGFFVSTNPASTPTTVVISATGAGVTRTATLTVNPVGTAPPPPPPSSGPLPAPTLIAPASDARFQPGQNVAFDWSDVTGAASYQFQVGLLEQLLLGAHGPHDDAIAVLDLDDLRGRSLLAGARDRRRTPRAPGRRRAASASSAESLPLQGDSRGERPVACVAPRPSTGDNPAMTSSHCSTTAAVDPERGRSR